MNTILTLVLLTATLFVMQFLLLADEKNQTADHQLHLDDSYKKEYVKANKTYGLYLKMERAAHQQRIKSGWYTELLQK